MLVVIWRSLYLILLMLSVACSPTQRPALEGDGDPIDADGGEDADAAVFDDGDAGSEQGADNTLPDGDDAAAGDADAGTNDDDCPPGGCSPEPFSFAVAADMRNYAGRGDCVVEFVVEVTSPLPQQYVWLTGTFTGWGTSLDQGAIALTRQDEIWTTEVSFDASADIEYKYLMKWPDTDQQWCTADFDCSSGSGNDGRWIDCATIEYDTPAYFRGACEAMARHGELSFLLSPGDLDPPARVHWTIQQYLGQLLPWYPVVGNHEIEHESHMSWLRGHNPGGDSLPGIVNTGPALSVETTYSFDQGDAHIVILNQYFDGSSDTGTDGDVDDALYDWLDADLAATEKPYIFVSGHEPAFPQADADWGRERHMDDCLNAHPANRDRFWSLLKEHQVLAYLCGHTHNYSAVEIDGVWQIDVGHARGAGDPDAPSTYLLIHVGATGVDLEVFRDTHLGSYAYTDIVHRHKLTGP